MTPTQTSKETPGIIRRDFRGKVQAVGNRAHRWNSKAEVFFLKWLTAKSAPIIDALCGNGQEQACLGFVHSVMSFVRR